MQLNEKSFKKFKSKWMVEAWPHVQLFHREGLVSTILVDSFIGKEKISDFWFLLVLGTRRRKEMPKKQKKNERRRTEKKEKLENAEEGVKIRFVLFISFLFYGLNLFWDCIFRFLVRMRDKKTKFNRENGTTLLLFLIFPVLAWPVRPGHGSPTQTV